MKPAAIFNKLKTLLNMPKHPTNEQLAKQVEVIKKLEDSLPRQSVAHKIVISTVNFTDKQLWVLSFALQHNSNIKSYLKSV